MTIKQGTKPRKGVHARVASSASSAKTIPAGSIPEPVRQHLLALTMTLRDIEGIIIVSAGALYDAGECVGGIVAHILRTQVSNRLGIEADRTADFLGVASEDGDK